MSLSIKEQERRYAAIRKLMAGDGLDCLLVGGRGDYTGRANIRYIADFGVISYEQYCVFPIEGTPVLIGRHAKRRGKSKWSLEFAGGTRNPVEPVKQAIARFDKGNKIGIVGIQDISGRVYEAVKGQVGNRDVDATGIFDQLRTFKSPEEIEQMRISASVGDKIALAVKDMIRPGLSDYDIYSEIKRITYQTGCEYSFDEIAVGSVHKSFLPVGERLESKGTLFIYVSPAYEGYFSQLAAKFPVGECQPEYRKLVVTWKQVLEAAVTLLRPGVRVSEVNSAMARVMTKAGFAPNSGFCGHDIGLSLAESWYFGDSESTQLKPGMTLALHPSILDGERGDILMGYTYLITDTGCETLNKIDLTELIL